MCRPSFSTLATTLLYLIAPLAALAQAAPPNDDLANAQLVTGSNFAVAGDYTHATAEAGEPPTDGVRTIWYLWTAPVNLNATLATSATSAGTVLNIYQISGTSTPSYSQFNYVASNSSGGTSTSISFPAAANTTYAIAVGAYSNTGNGGVTLSLSGSAGGASWVGPATPSAAGPANDNLAGAQPLTGAQFAAVGYYGAATTEVDEPSSDGSHTIWYVWTAPANLNATLSINADSSGTVLSAYQVSSTASPTYGKFNYIASNNTVGSSISLTFPVTANTTYAFCAGTYNPSTGDGSVILSLSSSPGDPAWAGPAAPTATQPANDELSKSQPRAGSQAAAIGYSGSATTEVDEPAGDGNRTIWYLWTAPGNLNATFSTNAESNGTIVTAYQVSGSSAPAYGQAAFIASNGSSGTSASITFPATGNTTYAIAIGAYTAATTNSAVALLLTSTPGDPAWIAPATPVTAHPANDDLAGAQLVSGTQFSVVGYNGSATTEAGEPAGDGSDTIWYLWTAPSNLSVTLSTAASSSGSILSAYQVSGTGTPGFGQFNAITSNGGGFSAAISFPAAANTTYAIAVGAYNASTSNGAVILTMSGAPLGLAGPVFRAPPPTGVTPANDNFANALALRDAQYYAVAYNASATIEAGEPAVTGYHTLWYDWTPPATGPATIETVRADYSHELSVFTGSTLTGLTQIGITEYGQPGSSGTLVSISFLANAHTPYHIALGTVTANPVSGALILRAIAPGHNTFPNAGRFAGFLDGGQDVFIELTISSSGAVSGKAIIGGKVFKLAGSLDISGNFSKTVSGVKFQLHLDPTGVSSTLTGTVTAPSGTYAVSLPVTAYGGSGPPPPPSRRFTVLIPPDPNAGPSGYGAGAVSVLSGGSLTFAGRLADGTAFSTSGWISNAGTWVLYLPLYSNAGRLTGAINFQQIAGVSDLSGSMTWVKPTTTKAAGFTAASTLIGSVYTAQRPALDFPNPPTAAFTLGGLAAAADYPALVQIGGTAKAMGISLSFNKTSGIITGSFKPAGAPRSLSVYGAVFQDQVLGAGYFLGPAAPGCFLYGN
jgi:hypothetical protein